MPRTYTPVEQNTFVAGLITEASPLTFPQNASLDEENFVLSKKGSRARRLGMDFEDGFTIIDTDVSMPADKNLIVSSFKWQNVGGDASRTLIVVQVAQKLLFFDAAAVPLSSGLITTWTYNLSEVVRKFSYASVDGILVVVTGGKDIDTFTYDNGIITKLSKRLKIRDLFGVTDIATGG